MIPEVLTVALTTLIGVVLPSYATFKALKQKTPQTRLLWLRYWVVFGFVYVLQMISDQSLSWMPLYNEFKVCAIIWLTMSKASGAQVVYAYVIYPLLVENESKIDKSFAQAKKQFLAVFWHYASRFGIQWSGLMCAMIRHYLEALTCGEYAQRLEIHESAGQQSNGHPQDQSDAFNVMPVPTANVTKRRVTPPADDVSFATIKSPESPRSKKHYTHILKPEDLSLTDDDDVTEILNAADDQDVAGDSRIPLKVQNNRRKSRN